MEPVGEASAYNPRSLDIELGSLNLEGVQSIPIPSAAIHMSSTASGGPDIL